MSLIYEKWRDLTINPFCINFKKIKLIDIYSFPGAQNDVVEGNCIYENEKIKCFIKIERSKMACFSAEINNIKLLCENNLYNKCAEIIETGIVDGKSYIVMRKIQGMKISELLREKKKINIDKYLLKYGRELATIHNVPVIGFDTAKQRVINDIPRECDYENIDSKIEKYIKILLETKLNYKFDTFIHGDFHYANILWENDEISGILDFEYSGKGFKEQDIAWSIVLRPGQSFLDNINDIQMFLQGYNQVGTYDTSCLKWCLINAYCHFYLMNKDEDYREKIIALLDIVNKL